MDKATLLHRAQIFAEKHATQDTCIVCGTPVEVQGHHIFPRHLSGPEDGPLVSLCAVHHLLIHRAPNEALEVNFTPKQQQTIKLLREFINRAKIVYEQVDPTLTDRKSVIVLPHGLLQRVHKRKADLGFSSLQDYYLYLVTKDCANL
jgi:hypothetical protein